MKITERSRQLGGVSIATMTEFLQNTNLKEKPGDFPADMKMISNLLNDHENTIKYLRKALKNAMKNTMIWVQMTF